MVEADPEQWVAYRLPCPDQGCKRHSANMVSCKIRYSDWCQQEKDKLIARLIAHMNAACQAGTGPSITLEDVEPYLYNIFCISVDKEIEEYYKVKDTLPGDNVDLLRAPQEQWHRSGYQDEATFQRRVINMLGTLQRSVDEVAKSVAELSDEARKRRRRD